MTEMETLLIDGLRRLSDQYAEDMTRLRMQVMLLQQQVSVLTDRVEALTGSAAILNKKLIELAGD